ncbi:hypothetical protein PVAP13_7NG392210 [Panicum virgatum]|uniref:Uncharacterized protein n=1 Tax=Panicum virgatum TaxID=38727 RepID=A0A8T0Q9F8_PANVG|nr:hypothetical protein PVAP13_7NG392210 [Panicum virgatum]
MMMLCFMVFTCLKWTPFSKIAMLGSFFYPTFIFLLEQFKYFVLEKRQDIWSLVILRLAGAFCYTLQPAPTGGPIHPVQQDNSGSFDAFFLRMYIHFCWL